MSFSIEVETEGIEENAEFFNQVNLEEGVGPRLEEVAKQIVSFARSIAPKVTGFYASNIYYEMIDAMTFEIRADAPYSQIVEEGSRPHIILPVHARALRFVKDGEIIFAKRVMHPGTIGQEIIGMAIRHFYAEIEDAVEEGAYQKVVDP